MQATFAKLLEIDPNLLSPDSLAAFNLAEKTWSRYGCPTDARGLCDVLEQIMRLCKREGILYPPVILKRKKALERGTWLPYTVRALETDMSRSSTSSSSTPTCALCGGCGYVPSVTGLSVTLCSCGAFLKRGSCVSNRRSKERLPSSGES